MKKVHIMDEDDYYVSLCGKNIERHVLDYLTIGAYEQINQHLGEQPYWYEGVICAHCLRKYNKMKENR